MNEELKYWAIVPAAGIGSRMQASKPKQYLMVAGKTIIEYSLQPLLADPRIEKVVVVLKKDDTYFSNLSIAKHKKIMTTIGGKERCHSVQKGLDLLNSYAMENDWVLVHDAARPLLAASDLNKLIKKVQEHEAGGLLGVPIHSTIKRVDDDAQVLETIPRRHLWRAFTPQIFRFGILCKALQKALPNNTTSDSAKAVEQLGYSPLMVEGRSDNIKLTRTNDLIWVQQLIENGGL